MSHHDTHLMDDASLAAFAWKPIPRFPGYEASENGEIRSVHGGRRSGKILRQKTFSPHGYRDVSLCKNGKVYTVIVHRAVAMAFHGDQGESRLVVAHINGDPRDNRSCNLKWCTAAENEAHKREHGTLAFGDKNGSAKLTNRQAKEVVFLHNKGAKLKALAERYGVSKTTICQIIRGETWSMVTRIAFAGRAKCPVTGRTVRVSKVAVKEAA